MYYDTVESFGHTNVVSDAPTLSNLGKSQVLKSLTEYNRLGGQRCEEL